jgi:hypothetical protein
VEEVLSSSLLLHAVTTTASNAVTANTRNVLEICIGGLSLIGCRPVYGATSISG